MKNRREFLKGVTLGGVGATLYGFSGRSSAWGSSPDSVISPGAAASHQKIVLESQWRFQKEGDVLANGLPPAKPEFDDASWDIVGVPHCYNDLDTFENLPMSKTFQGNAWYRTHFKLDESARDKKIFLEFQGVNIATAVYVNGTFKPGNTKVPQPGQVTHVGCFLPFLLDITNDVKFGADNVLVVRVSNIGEKEGHGGNDATPGEIVAKPFHANPGFGTYLGFGMGFGGIICPVTLHITNKVHVPFNCYSPLEKWGNYVSAISASDETAQIRMQTNVENEDSVARDVTLVTQILDADNKVVATLNSESRNLKPGEVARFDQSAPINRPHLWYPNNSPYGKPYLYRVISQVRVEDNTVDVVESPLGVRMITWDDDYCYVNGKKHLLNGFGQRNIYPALGSAIPAEIQWNDVRLMADCGGNTLRVGHVPPMLETVKACDAYGILVMMNSGDNEWNLQYEPAVTYKWEYDRDMLVAYRNHPSIAVWESNNGFAHKTPAYSPASTMKQVDQWDYLQPRIVSTRNGSDYWPTDRKMMVGYTNDYKKVKGSPSANFEVYGANWRGGRSFCMARFDYADEKTFSDHYVSDYLDNIGKQACGWIDWMLAETQGEAYTMYLNGMRKQKSLGSCAMDGNRFPKLIYGIFKNALWVPFLGKPGVVLQSHWNYSGTQDVAAWTNCYGAELFLNGVSLGVCLPDKNLRCDWRGIPWQSGTIKVVGLDDNGHAVCSDFRQTAGAPHHIVLTAEPRLVKPNGETFQITANGSDAAIITAKIVDAEGIWCPLADNNIRFKVSGPGNYRGSYNFYVTPGKPIGYHAPGDPELQAEGGLMRVAIRSTFQPGTVQVTADSDGLGSGDASFEVAGNAA